MTVSWPISGNFPQEFKQGVARGYRTSNRKITEMEVGPSKVRLVDRVAGRTITGVVQVNTVQMLRLETFFETDTAYGTTPFEWHDPATGITATYRFEGDAPFTVQHVAGERWDCTLSLLQMP